jgi:uncharacterized membrane protein (UPF0127 family)
MTRRVTVRNATRGCVLAERAEMATGFLRRALGLMGRHDWSSADGMLIAPCNCVHTLFMGISIDLVHTSVEGTVLRTVRALRPWRVGPVVSGSRCVVELPVGVVESTGTRIGDHLEFEVRRE